MSFEINASILVGALLILVARICDMSLDTIRVLFVMRGKKGLAWILGFLESAIYIVAVSSVLAHIGNPYNVLGYAAGFATGNVIGMYIEERLAIGFTQMTIISSTLGASIATALRAQGHAVTEIPARGKDGTVAMLQCSVRRRDIDDVDTIVLEADPNAFVTAEDVRPVRRGFWRA
jgi:uncharacterized protein YebE (UPF0316 family)